MAETYQLDKRAKKRIRDVKQKARPGKRNVYLY